MEYRERQRQRQRESRRQASETQRKGVYKKSVLQVQTSKNFLVTRFMEEMSYL